MFRESYVEQFSSLGVELREEDGSSIAEIERAEERLQFVIPQSLREFYLVAGCESRLNQFHNRLLAPSEWVIDRGYLSFMEENQWVVYWGVSVDRDVERDPEVFQGVNRREDGIEWLPEHESCCEFLNTMLVWNASYGGAAASSTFGYGDEFEIRQWLDQHCQLIGEVNEMRAYRHRYGSMSFLKANDLITKMRKVSPWRVYAAATSSSNLKLLQSSLDVKWEESPGENH